jgi:hypothetical protein
VDAARLIGTGFAQGLVDLAPIDVGSARAEGEGNAGDGGYQACDTMHGRYLLKVDNL